MVFCLHYLFFYLTPAVLETACLAVCLLPPHFLFETIAAVHHPSVWNERTKTVQYGQLTLEDDVSNLTVARQGSKS